MVVKRQEDLVNGGEIVIVEGNVDRIIIKEAEATPKNIEYGVTHVASLQVDGQYINFISLSIREGREPDVTVNTGTKAAPKWERIEQGDTVRVVVQESVKGDKTYYNAKRTGIKLVKKGPGGQSSQAGSTATAGSTQQASYKPKDMTGVSVGHSFNGAMNFLLTFGVEASNENITSYAASVHTVTEKLKTVVKASKPDMSDYDIGASVGNAVLNACKLVGTNVDFETTLEAIATDLLQNVVPVIEKFIRDGKGAAQAPKVTRAAPAAKKAATKAKAAPKAEPEVVDDLDDDIPDDDIPF